MAASGNKESTDLPTFGISINGKVIKSNYQVQSIAVIKEINRIASARLVIADGDPSLGKFTISETADFIPGSKVEIKAGYKSKNKSIFKGTIVNQSIRSKSMGLPLLIVDCKDPAYQMSLVKKSGFFYKITDSDIIQKAAQKYGLKSKLEATKTKHSEMVQFQVTDWEFCVNRAERNGKYIVSADGTLILASPDLSTPPVLKFSYGDNIMEIETSVESRNQFPKVKSEAWDSSLQKLQAFDAQKPSFKEQGNLKASTLSGLAKENDYKLIHSGNVPARELQAWANAKLEKSMLSKIMGRVKCQGTSKVNPSDTIEFEKLSKRYNGRTFVSGVRHTINEKNWETDIQFGIDHAWLGDQPKFTASNGFVPDINGLHLGTVTQLKNDPDGEDRVLVKIPAVDSKKDGIWARVSSLDAGKNRGAFFRPEIDDEVVLGFLSNDPRHPVVLGMLNSSKNPAPFKAKDENHKKGFVTREGIKLLFDDKDKILTLESPNGNILTISDKDGGISLVDENKNSITMDKDGIIIESGKDMKLKSKGKLDIEGNDVSIKAQKNFKCSGSTGVELSSDASAVIKGSMVEIN